MPTPRLRPRPSPRRHRLVRRRVLPTGGEQRLAGHVDLADDLVHAVPPVVGEGVQRRVDPPRAQLGARKVLDPVVGVAQVLGDGFQLLTAVDQLLRRDLDVALHPASYRWAAWVSSTPPSTTRYPLPGGYWSGPFRGRLAPQRSPSRSRSGLSANPIRERRSPWVQCP